MPLQTIGRYQVLSELGRGGMAVVYRAVDPQIGREVAIKVLPRELLHDREFRARFQREAEALARLEHPAIVPIYDVGEHDGQPYLVMRLMAGGSLADRLQQGMLSLAETARIIGDLAPALDYAHSHTIIHRDLKPANILFDQLGKPYLSDFGIVRMSEATGGLTGSGSIGTPDYMAPEIARPGGLTPLIDVYALGVTAFQMLSGRLPYQADTPMGTLVAHITEPIPDLLQIRPNLPTAARAFVERALAKNPTERYQSAADLAAALADLRDARAATGATLRVHTPPVAPASGGQLISPPPSPPLRGSEPEPAPTIRAPHKSLDQQQILVIGLAISVVGLLVAIFLIQPGLKGAREGTLGSSGAVSSQRNTNASQAPSATPWQIMLTPRPTLPASTVRIGHIYETQGVTMLGQDVVAAGYSASLDRLVTVTRNTNRLEIVQTPDMKQANIQMPNPGTSLSISPSGLFAVVGHSEQMQISYYDLQAAKLIRTNVAIDGVSALALSDSGQVFIISAQAEGKSLRVIDTTTSFETDLGVAVEGSASLALTPDGQTLLMLSQIDTHWHLSAYQITSQKTIRLIGSAASEIAGDSCHQFWVTPDSRRVITSCGRVFATEPDEQGRLPQLEDLLPLGTVRSVGYLAASNQIITAADPPESPPPARTTAQSNVLNLYGAQSLNWESAQFVVPKAGDGENKTEVEVYAILPNRQGNTFYVIVYVPAFHDFGLVTQKVELASTDDAFVANKPTMTPIPPADLSAEPLEGASVTALGLEVIDAAYDQNGDRIVLIADDPPRLELLLPDDAQSVGAVKLTQTPLRLALSPDGQHAAVLGPQDLTYIDLKIKQIISHMPLNYTESIEASNMGMLLADDGTLYLFVGYYQEQKLRIFDAATGAERDVQMSPPPSGVHYRFTPDGQSIYGIARNIPEGLERLSVSADGGLAYAYYFPYPYGGYQIGDNLWLSTDGSRIFNACGGVFQVTGQRGSDMAFSGNLGSLGSIRSLAHVEATNLLLALPGERDGIYGCFPDHQIPDNQLLLFDYEDLHPRQALTLPDLEANGEHYPVQGQFVFANRAGTRYYMLVRARDRQALPNDAALIVLPAEAL
ncbi:MAG: protein kinase [Oscillochloris sp.]|nr:protein kinase [Oscillochloris sp.]